MTEPNKTTEALNESLSPYNGPDAPDAPDNNIEPIINKDPTPLCIDEIDVLIHNLDQYVDNNPNPLQNEFEFENPFDLFVW